MFNINGYTLISYDEKTNTYIYVPESDVPQDKLITRWDSYEPAPFPDITHWNGPCENYEGCESYECYEGGESYEYCEDGVYVYYDDGDHEYREGCVYKCCEDCDFVYFEICEYDNGEEGVYEYYEDGDCEYWEDDVYEHYDDDDCEYYDDGDEYWEDGDCEYYDDGDEYYDDGDCEYYDDDDCEYWEDDVYEYYDDGDCEYWEDDVYEYYDDDNHDTTCVYKCCEDCEFVYLESCIYDNGEQDVYEYREYEYCGENVYGYHEESSEYLEDSESSITLSVLLSIWPELSKRPGPLITQFAALPPPAMEVSVKEEEVPVPSNKFDPTIRRPNLPKKK